MNLEIKLAIIQKLVADYVKKETGFVVEPQNVKPVILMNYEDAEFEGFKVQLTPA